MGGCRRAGAPNTIGLRGGCCVASRWLRTSPKLVCLPLSASAGDRGRSAPQDLGFSSAVNRGGQALSWAPAGQVRDRTPGAELAPQRRARRELRSSARALLGQGPRGSPATRARALPLSLTHARTHTLTHSTPEPDRSWAAERVSRRAQRTRLLLSGVEQKAEPGLWERRFRGAVREHGAG